MAEWWNKDKEVEPVTLVDCKRTVLVGKKTSDKDGYDSKILGITKKNLKKSEQKNDFLKKSSNFSVLKEFRIEKESLESDLKEGDQVKVSLFKENDIVKVTAFSKGKGTQGVVKRHGFAGGPKTHGHRHVLRSAGSIGSAFPEHVQKGKRMAGRMGFDQVTLKNVKIAWIDEEKSIIAVKGAVPGRKGSWVKLVKA